MSHFLDISELTKQGAEGLIQQALRFKARADYPSYAHHTVANLFYENSTRTRVSFELAANHLNMPVINLDMQGSSEKKGEQIEDTIQTLAAMGISVFVLRHQHERLPHEMAIKCPGVHIINAGDGCHAHPSQALLDMMTIFEQKPDLSQLKIAIVGDVRHSRVANSFQWLGRLLGVGELTLIAPTIWQPENTHFGQVTHSLKDGLHDADIVMCLRVQSERLKNHETMDLASYHQNYALTTQALQYAKADALVMHPGPVNRGVEIDSEVADGMQSMILKQVENGVFARMAILQHVLTATRAL